MTTQSDRQDLLDCYRSDQISEAAWQEHLIADPILRTMFDKMNKDKLKKSSTVSAA